jgi:hypothetical protein
MKKLFITSALLLCTWSQNAAAETVVDKIAANKTWSSYTLTGHSAWNKEACIASTLGGKDSILEVYAEKTSGGYTEPTVQVLFSNVPQAFSADVITSAVKKWNFLLGSPTQDPTLQAVVARLGDRQDIITALRNDNGVIVKIRDSKGKLLKTLNFSLSGSSKTIDAQATKCQLKFVEL